MKPCYNRIILMQNCRNFGKGMLHFQLLALPRSLKTDLTTLQNIFTTYNQFRNRGCINRAQTVRIPEFQGNVQNKPCSYIKILLYVTFGTFPSCWIDTQISNRNNVFIFSSHLAFVGILIGTLNKINRFVVKALVKSCMYILGFQRVKACISMTKQKTGQSDCGECCLTFRTQLVNQ